MGARYDEVGWANRKYSDVRFVVIEALCRWQFGSRTACSYSLHARLALKECCRRKGFPGDVCDRFLMCEHHQRSSNGDHGIRLLLSDCLLPRALLANPRREGRREVHGAETTQRTRSQQARHPFFQKVFITWYDPCRLAPQNTAPPHPPCPRLLLHAFLFLYDNPLFSPPPLPRDTLCGEIAAILPKYCPPLQPSCTSNQPLWLFVAKPLLRLLLRSGGVKGVV